MRAELTVGAAREHAVEDALSDTQKFGVLQGREPTLSAFARVFAAKKKVVLVVGAGVSTSAGIPDFRSPGTGLYAQMKKDGCARPEAAFCIDSFKQDPKPFNVRAKTLWPGQHKPARAHTFMRELDKRGMLLRIYTQNIDGLERLAGVSEERVMQCHGGFRSARCSLCQKDADINEVKKTVFAGGVPTCECGGFIKPDVVFFGENLPKKYAEMHEKDMQEADAVIVMGSSLQVRPVTVGPFQRPVGRANYRDVSVLGPCDEGVALLAEELGWKL